MIYNLPQFAGKDVVFIGQGREGVSFKRFIENIGTIKSFRFVDKNDGEDYLENLKKLDLTKTIIVKTAGCPGSSVPVPYTTSTAVFFTIAKASKAKIIGVTGTKGKTTTSSLLAAMLRYNNDDVRLCGNIGLPMLNALDIQITDKTIFVIELSSYQLTELNVSPDMAIVTNLFHDHIDYHGSIEAYWGAKKHIMQFMNQSGVFIFNSDIPELNTWAKEFNGMAIAVTPQPVESTNTDMSNVDSLSFIDLSKSSLFGDHNLANARLATSMAKQMGMFDEDIQHVIETFVPVKHRLQIVSTKNDVVYIDDAIASQPESAIAGIEAVTKYIAPVGCIFLGGSDRQYSFRDLAKTIVDHKISRFVLFPDTGLKIFEVIKLLSPNYEIKAHQTYDMKDAVVWASANTPPRSVVLLSCGSPSYSVWKDFEEKGEQFQAAVSQL